MTKKFLQKKFIILYVCLLFIFLYVFFARAKYVVNPQYGISFNTIYAQELGLNWKTVYNAIFKELNIKKIRLAAHWNMIEPQKDQFNFVELDYQVQKAAEHNAEITLAVGKRLPRWPECHIPEWALNLSPEDQEQRILLYVQTVVERYKQYDAIKVWQVENEPFLSMFAKDHCFN